MFSHLRRYLIAGLLVWIPLGVTVLVIRLVVEMLDRTLVLIPEAYRPETLLGVHIPGFGVILAALVVLATGAIAANLFGRRLVAGWESILAHIPLVRPIYSAVKQLAETLFSSSGQSFRKVVMLEYPRRGIWTLAFVTSTEVGEAQQKTGKEVFNLYVPTTPNPTSGFFLIVPREEVVELDMSVDEGLKMLISMGAVVTGRPKEAKSALEAAQK